MATISTCDTEIVLDRDFVPGPVAGLFEGSAVVEVLHAVTGYQLSDLTVTGNELHLTATADVKIDRETAGACKIASGESFIMLPFTVSENSVMSIRVQDVATSEGFAVVDLQLAEDDVTVAPGNVATAQRSLSSIKVLFD